MAYVLAQGSAQSLPLADESVQCVVTSPPYFGLRQYVGEQHVTWADGTTHPLGLEPTHDLYVAHMVEVFREVRRVLRPDGVLWLNIGDSYAGSWGAQVKPKDLIGIPWRVAFALQSDGWYLRSDIIWAKPNPMPESVTDRPTRSHEYVFLMAKSERYFYDADAIREDHGSKRSAGANAFRGQRSLRERGAGDLTEQSYHQNGRNKRDVWTIATRPYPEAHYAVFPEELVEPCILAGSAPGDVVLDPFNGSGTVGRVALRHGRRYVGIDISAEYLRELAIARIDPLAAAALAATEQGGDVQGVLFA